MRVISCTTEREVDCACGARLSFWPADVTRTSIAVPWAPGSREAAAGYALILGDHREASVVRCPCCSGLVEVGGG